MIPTARSPRTQQSQRTFVGSLKVAEGQLEMVRRPLKVPLNEAITSDASTIFYLMGMHGLSLTPDEENLYAMVRIAFGMNKEDAKKYFRAKEQEMLSTDAALEQASKRETEEVTW